MTYIMYSIFFREKNIKNIFVNDVMMTMNKYTYQV